MAGRCRCILLHDRTRCPSTPSDDDADGLCFTCRDEHLGEPAYALADVAIEVVANDPNCR